VILLVLFILLGRKLFYSFANVTGLLLPMLFAFYSFVAIISPLPPKKKLSQTLIHVHHWIPPLPTAICLVFLFGAPVCVHFYSCAAANVAVKQLLGNY